MCGDLEDWADVFYSTVSGTQSVSFRKRLFQLAKSYEKNVKVFKLTVEKGLFFICVFSYFDNIYRGPQTSTWPSSGNAVREGTLAQQLESLHWTKLGPPLHVGDSGEAWII